MFDFENPFSGETLPVENAVADAEWEHIVNAPERQVEGDLRAADREAAQEDREMLLADFHEHSEQRRKERMQRTAYRYALLAMACGLLAYACGYYGINWLAWTIGTAASIFAIISSYGFGRVYEMG